MNGLYRREQGKIKALITRKNNISKQFEENRNKKELLPENDEEMIIISNNILNKRKKIFNQFYLFLSEALLK